MEAGRVPRAYSLAVLALEEFGKANLCLYAIGAGPGFAPEFWKSWRTHPRKLIESLGMQSLANGLGGQTVQSRLAEIVTNSKGTHDLKLRGLYVDYDQAGQLQLPQSITREAAEAVIEVAADASAMAQVWLQPDVPEALLSVATPETLDRVRAMAEQAALADPEGAFERARELLARGTGQPYVAGEVSPSPDPLANIVTEMAAAMESFQAEPAQQEADTRQAQKPDDQ